MLEADVDALTRALHQGIPLAAAMDLRVIALDEDGTRLSAPLAPNRNPHGGAFGGSIAALGLTACWLLADRRARAVAPGATVMVADQHVEYLSPALSALEATCADPGETGWAPFERALARRGRARVELGAAIRAGDTDVARLRARFVALRD
jgi:thioesterase domain-containing protein